MSMSIVSFRLVGNASAKADASMNIGHIAMFGEFKWPFDRLPPFTIKNNVETTTYHPILFKKDRDREYSYRLSEVLKSHFHVKLCLNTLILLSYSLRSCLRVL